MSQAGEAPAWRVRRRWNTPNVATVAERIEDALGVGDGGGVVAHRHPLDRPGAVGHRIVRGHQQLVTDRKGGMDDQLGLVGGRLLAGDVFHGHQRQLAGEDLLVVGERLSAIAAEEQVGTKGHRSSIDLAPTRTGSLTEARPRTHRGNGCGATDEDSQAGLLTSTAPGDLLQVGQAGPHVVLERVAPQKASAMPSRGSRRITFISVMVTGPW